MGWTINTRDISAVTSLERAVEIWDKAQPWRSRHASRRPLAGKRMPHKHIVKLSEDRGYECVLYSTPVVTYFTDGRIALRCYDSASTHAFAWRVKPAGCAPTSCQGRMFWGVQTDEGTRFYKQNIEALLLEPTAGGNWKLLNAAEVQYEMVNDNPKRAAIRKQVKPYATWYALTERLRGSRLPKVWAPNISYALLPTLSSLQDHETYPKLAKTLGRPEDLLEALYLDLGGQVRTPVPHDRLPRNFA